MLPELKMSKTDVESNWTARRTFFTPLPYTFSAKRCANTGIGSMKTTLKSISSWIINTGLIKHIKMIPHLSLRKMCTMPSVARLSFTWRSYRMHGSAKRQMRSSFTLTVITESSSMVHWRLFMVPKHLDHSHAEHWWLYFADRQGQNPVVPQEFKDAYIGHLYIRKGNKTGNFVIATNISLLLTAGKVLAHLLLNHLLADLEHGLLPKSQCGFWKDSGTVDMVFAAQQLQEKCQEQNQDLYSSFIDLTKAFDIVCHNDLWKIISTFGCPPKFITLVHSPYDRMLVQVLNDGQSSDAFPVTNRVKQGCVLAKHYSAYCLLLCYLMHSQMMRTPSNYASKLMGICST